MLKCAGTIISVPFFSSPCSVAAFPAKAPVYPTLNAQTVWFHSLKALLDSKPAVGMSSNQKVSAAKWDLIAQGLRYQLLNLKNKTLWGATYGAV